MGTEKIFYTAGSNIEVSSSSYSKIVRKFTNQGATTSDAQGMADLHFMNLFGMSVKKFSKDNLEDIAVLTKAVEAYRSVGQGSADRVSASMKEISDGIGGPRAIEDIASAIQSLIRYEIEVAGHTVEQIHAATARLLALRIL